MADNESPSTDRDETAPAGEIDLAGYRTGELAERLVELISVPEALRKIITAVLLVVALAVAGCCLLYAWSDFTLLPLVVCCLYALAAAVILGLLLGVLRVIATGLENIEAILGIVLETSGEVADDYGQLQADQIELPSGGELVEQVYHGVLLPVLERSVAKAFGFLGTPILWTYRRTIGSAVRYLIRRVDRTAATGEDDRQLAENAMSGLAAAAPYVETIGRYTTSASDVVESVGRKIRLYAMLPMYALLVTAAVVAIVPILAVGYFTGG